MFLYCNRGTHAVATGNDGQPMLNSNLVVVIRQETLYFAMEVMGNRCESARLILLALSMAACASEDSTYDVLVVGAGAAGLSAADALLNAGEPFCCCGRCPSAAAGLSAADALLLLCCPWLCLHLCFARCG